MSTRLSILGLYLCVFLTGLYAGMGFFIIMGGVPAVSELSGPAFAEYWQHVDRYMIVRMPVFGILLLLFMLFTISTLISSRSSLSLWLITAALVIVIGDLAYSFNVSKPLNRLTQSWDLQQLPTNIKEIQQQVVHTFWYRCTFMLLPFVLTLLGLFFRGKKRQKSTGRSGRKWFGTSQKNIEIS